MKISQMNTEHVSQVIAIDRQCYKSPMSRKTLDSTIRKARGGLMHAVVAIEGDEVVGYLIAEINSPDIQILSIGVQESSRRKGVGTKLVSYIFDLLRDHKCIGVNANVEEHKLEAHFFFSSQGFLAARTLTIGDKDAYRFRYTVPFDNLSDMHIRAIAENSLAKRLVKAEEDDALDE